MTVDETDLGDSFTGVMKNLNLDTKEIDRAGLASADYKTLADAKSQIEFELETLFDLLKHKYNFDMEQPLVVDGFPRADVDVVTIRLIRTKIIRLRNDHKYVMGLLESLLIKQLAAGAGSTELSKTAPSPVLVNFTIPFALVELVAENGPAHASGLRQGDKIVSFDGDIHAGNNNKLTAIAARVRSKADTKVEVKIVRAGETHVVELVPTDKWDGRGLLGCFIVPC